MAAKFISLRNLRFMLYEVLEAEGLTGYEYFQDHSRETFDLALETAMKMGRDLLHPAFIEMDRKPPEFDGAGVRVHPAVRQIMRECGEGGWIGASFTAEYGGQQMPNLIMSAFRAIFSAANYSASVYPLLTTGAANLILVFGSPELIGAYVPPMLAGRWQGTMAMTEPQAGSSLAEIACSAEPAAGYYLMRGQKIFITAADHDGADNVVNLLLARIKGAPAGVKGISLFVVPKLRPAGDGLEPNDLACAGLYHKLGYRGAPLTQLALGENGDCRGWLVGEANQGLRYMFQMMNEARLDVGMAAAAIASAGYYSSLAYARERTQGRKAGAKDPAGPPCPIIEHADVRRMLLFQRAVVEGSMALNLRCAHLVDLIRARAADTERCHLLLDLLTPVAKSYPSEMGVLAVSAGLQVLGGYGYCDEFPLEQHWRDARIHPIHEGTTGIQGMDLLGRKVTMKGGKGFAIFLEEVEATISAARAEGDLASAARSMNGAIGTLREVTEQLARMAADPEMMLADATLYLELFGIVAVAWQWLTQAVAATRGLRRGPSEEDANFYRGKLGTFRYFFAYELPKAIGLAERLKKPDRLTVDLKAEWLEE